jgi:dienelactone hydrolase
MRQAKADCQLVKYSGVQHSFTNPEASSAGIPGIVYDAAADRRSWQAMENFLKELF